MVSSCPTDAVVEPPIDVQCSAMVDANDDVVISWSGVPAGSDLDIFVGFVPAQSFDPAPASGSWTFTGGQPGTTYTFALSVDGEVECVTNQVTIPSVVNVQCSAAINGAGQPVITWSGVPAGSTLNILNGTTTIGTINPASASGTYAWPSGYNPGTTYTFALQIGGVTVCETNSVTTPPVNADHELTEVQWRQKLLDGRDGYGRNAGTGSLNWPLACPTSVAQFRQVAGLTAPYWIDMSKMPGSAYYGVDTPVLVNSNKVVESRGVPHEMRGSGIRMSKDNGPIGENVIIHNLCIVDTEATGAASGEAGRGVMCDRYTDVWIDHVTVRNAWDEGIEVSTYKGYNSSQGPLEVSVSYCFAHSRQGRNYAFFCLPNNPAIWDQGPPSSAVGDEMLKVTGWRNCSDDRTQPFNGSNLGGGLSNGFRGPMGHGVNLDWVNNSVRFEDIGALIEDWPEETQWQGGSHWGSQFRAERNVYDAILGSGNHLRKAGQSPLSTMEPIANLHLGGGVNQSGWGGNIVNGLPDSLTIYSAQAATQANRSIWEATCGCRQSDDRVAAKVCGPGEPGGVVCSFP